MAEPEIKQDQVTQPLLDQEPQKKGGIFGSTFNMCSAIMGAGILTLPSAFSQLGVGLGIGMIVFFAIFSGFSCMMLYKIYSHYGETSYSGLSKKLIGDKFEWVVDLIQLLYSTGACCGYTIIIGNELAIFMSYMFEETINPDIHWIIERPFILSLITLVCILPPALLKHMDSLKFTSFVGVACVLYLTVVMIINSSWSSPCELADIADYTCKAGKCMIESSAHLVEYNGLENCTMLCEGCAPDPVKTEIQNLIFSTDIFLAMPLFCFGCCCQVQFLPIVDELNKPTTKRVSAVVIMTYIMIIVIYSINAMGGYFSFCGYVTSNILDSFPAENILILISRITLSVTLCFCFPLYSYSIRSVALKLMRVKDQAYWKVALTTVVIVLLILTVALCFTDLGTVLGLTGAIFGSCLMAIFPAILFWKYIKETQPKGKYFYYSACVFYIVMGAIIAILGSVTTFM
ncbi:hypothetical protein WA158_006327 [Blastocystis sp. Blastoise]